MWRKQLKNAFRQFKANPLFTAINLFGVSITLTFLMVFVTRYDYEINPGPPEIHARQSLHFDYAYMQGPGQANWGTLAYGFIREHVLPLRKYGTVAFFSQKNIAQKRENTSRHYVAKFCNAAYWRIMDFDFVKGTPFYGQHIA